MEQSMVAHGGESQTRKANARRHVAHATVFVILALISHSNLLLSQKYDSFWILGFGDEDKKSECTYLDFSVMPPVVNTLLYPKGFSAGDAISGFK